MYVRWRTGYATTPWILIMTPGIGLILMALAILIWPQLLAYMVATAMLVAGIALAGWGWSMRSAHKRRMAQENVHQATYYEVR
jgi:uncharacterized membrane protein YqjE